jgi:hypothetical protein
MGKLLGDKILLSRNLGFFIKFLGERVGLKSLGKGKGDFYKINPRFAYKKY